MVFTVSWTVKSHTKAHVAFQFTKNSHISTHLMLLIIQEDKTCMTCISLPEDYQNNLITSFIPTQKTQNYWEMPIFSASFSNIPNVTSTQWPSLSTMYKTATLIPLSCFIFL